MTMARPRIGISFDTGAPDESRRVLEIPDDYCQAVFAAGGLPILLTHTADGGLQAELLGSVEALIVPGGRDIDPALYGEPRHPKARVMDPLRQAFDLALLKLAEARMLPTLGICLGCQMMNVQRGGSLYQNVAEAFPESPVTHTRIEVSDPANPTRSSFHAVALRPGTQLQAIFGAEEIQANSRHRQAVHRLGKGLIPTAYAPDGILEALEDYTLPFWIGVQWHPENLRTTEHLQLFKALVAAAGRV